MWGGATFDTAYRFLKEDPWERLEVLREKCPNILLQMLLRGANAVGYKNYPDNVIREFVKQSAKTGIDVFRIFDSLNWIQGMEVALDETLNQGMIAEPCLCYTGDILDASKTKYTLSYYVRMAKELEKRGAHILGIKDMSGLLKPTAASKLVGALKQEIGIPIHLHTHDTCGTGEAVYLAAALAGVDIVDCALSPFAGGTSQPATETLAYALRQLGYEVDLDDKCTKKIADYFKVVRDDYIKDGTLMPKSMATDTQCLTYQIPGGMLSNLLSQLKQVNALDRFDEVLVETPKVRKDMGYPPLVTPTSQMVGVQAVRNVLDGQRYKSVSKEIKAYCRGEYGHTPAPIDPEIQKMILGDEKPLTVRYADTLEPVVDKTREKLGDLARSDEDVLSYIAFPNLAEKFFEERKAKEENVATYSIVEC